MTEKAITTQQKKLKHAMGEACRSHALEQSQHDAIISYNQMVVGMHEYYNMATMICADVHRLFLSIDKTMKTRLNDRQSLTKDVPEKRKGGMDEYFYQKYQKSKQLRFIMVVVPVAYCKTCNPMCHSPTVNRYTSEGRAEIHRMLLKDAYVDVLLQLGKDNSLTESIEYCDNRLARFVAVKGKCEISKKQLLFEDVVCHRFIPKEQGGTDEYKNLRIIHKDVEQLLYETNVNTIQMLIERTDCKESAKLTKLNKWRKNVGREPINLITLKNL